MEFASLAHNAVVTIAIRAETSARSLVSPTLIATLDIVVATALAWLPMYAVNR